MYQIYSENVQHIHIHILQCKPISTSELLLVTNNVTVTKANTDKF